MSKFRPHPSQPNDPYRPNTKRTGEHSEIAFLYRADQRRFAISRPFGDSERYDCILDNRPIPGYRFKPNRIPRLFRIQVNCTDVHPRRSLRNPRDLLRRQSAAPSTPSATSISSPPTSSLSTSGTSSRSKSGLPNPCSASTPTATPARMRLEKYREAWHLLDPSTNHPRQHRRRLPEGDYVPDEESSRNPDSSVILSEA